MNATTKPETLASLKKKRDAMYQRLQQLNDMRTLDKKMHGDFPECELFREMVTKLAAIRDELLVEYKELNKEISARGSL